MSERVPERIMQAATAAYIRNGNEELSGAGLRAAVRAVLAHADAEKAEAVREAYERALAEVAKQRDIIVQAVEAGTGADMRVERAIIRQIEDRIRSLAAEVKP